jgi:hypothetical protein
MWTISYIRKQKDGPTNVSPLAAEKFHASGQRNRSQCQRTNLIHNDYLHSEARFAALLATKPCLSDCSAAFSDLTEHTRFEPVPTHVES